MTARRTLLGELERAVLARLWSAGPADVRAMHAAVGVPRGIAPNTVQSTLERLHRKGLAERHKQRRAFVYTARQTREEWVAGAVRDLVEAVGGMEGPLPLAAFVDLAARAGGAELEALERLVRERRRRRGGDEP